jgi:hypothetical protein
VAEPYSTKKIGRGFRLDEADRLLIEEEEARRSRLGRRGRACFRRGERGGFIGGTERGRRGEVSSFFFCFSTGEEERSDKLTTDWREETHAG